MSDETPTIGDLEDFVLNSCSSEQVAKASQTAALAVQDAFSPEDLVPDAANEEDWIALYTKHVWAYCAIFAVANAIAPLKPCIKRYVYETGELEEDEETRGHKALRLLRRPNDQMTGQDLLFRTIVYLETCGDAYWEVVFDTISRELAGHQVERTEEPSELWSIRPSWISPVPRKDARGVEKYVYQTKKWGRKTDFDLKNIIHYNYFHPLQDWTGMGSVAPAADSLRLDESIRKWNQDFFERGTLLEGVLSTEQRLTPREMHDFGEQVGQFLRGKGRHFLIASKGMSFDPISVNPKDVDFEAGLAENRQAILAALGVPPVMVGLMEHAKYDNFALQIEAFRKITIVPKVRQLEDTLNCFLLPKFPDLQGTDEFEYVLSFDKTELMQEDKDRLLDRGVKALQNGAMTPNELRASLGMDPYPEGVEGGDDFYVKKGVVPMSMVAMGPETDELQMREAGFQRSLDELEDRIGDGIEGLKERLRREIEDERDGD